MAKKAKYLSYIEEHRKHHSKIEKEAKTSARKAIRNSHKKAVPVTFMKGERIIRVAPSGSTRVVATLKNNRRKVKVGEKAILQKK